MDRNVYKKERNIPELKQKHNVILLNILFVRYFDKRVMHKFQKKNLTTFSKMRFSQDWIDVEIRGLRQSISNIPG